MLLITGEIERVTTRKAGRPGEQWDEQTLIVRDWGETLYVTVGRTMEESHAVPQAGDRVALECSVRAYVRRENGNLTGQAGFGYTAHRRNAEAEKALYGSGLKAASGS